MLGQRGQFVEHLIRGRGGVAEALDVEQGGLQGRRDQALQVAMRDAGFGVLGGDHLALLGQAQRTVDRTGRLGQDRVVARAAAAADGAAATMEEPQPDSRRARRLDQIQFGAVQRPVGRQVAAVLVGIGIPQHDLLGVAAGGDHRPVDRDREGRLQDRRAALQIVDGLEQRHDTDRHIWMFAGKVQQPSLFEQQRRLQQVRDRLAHRDDVGGHRFGAEGFHRVGGGGDDVEFLTGQRGQFGVVADQRPAGGQLGHQQCDPLLLVQRRIVGMHPGPGPRFGHHLLVGFGVLPHVQPAQVKTEGVQRIPQPGQPVVGQQCAAVRAQRGVDDVEIGPHLHRAGVGLQAQIQIMLGHPVQHGPGGGRQPPAHHPDGPAVGLVGAGVVEAVLPECGQRVVDVDQPHRHRQLLLQPVQLVEVVRERGVGGTGGGKLHHLGGDVGVAVAVTADPRTGPQDRARQQFGAGPAAAQSVAHRGVDLRHHLEERRRVVPQPGLDLVGNLQARQANQRGLPQREDLAAELVVDGAAVVDLGATVQAQPHQPGDAVLGVENGAAAGLGGVRGDDRRHQCAVELVGDLAGGQRGLVELAIGGCQRAVARRLTGRQMDLAAAFPVDVLGDVGQQREGGERADHRDGVADLDALEHGGQLRTVDLGAAHPEGRHPGPFDQVEHLGAVLLADGVAQHRAEQADVAAHRFGGLLADLAAVDGADGLQRRVSHGFTLVEQIVQPEGLGTVGKLRHHPLVERDTLFAGLDDEPCVQAGRRPDQELSAQAAIGERLRGRLAGLRHQSEFLFDDPLQGGHRFVGGERRGVSAGEFQAARLVLAALGVPLGAVGVVGHGADHRALPGVSRSAGDICCAET